MHGLLRLHLIHLLPLQLGLVFLLLTIELLLLVLVALVSIVDLIVSRWAILSLTFEWAGLL